MVSAAPSGAIDRLQNDFHQIGDINEIAACIYYETLLVLGQTVKERRQGAAHVPRAIGIGQAEGNEVNAAEIDVVLTGGLADRVAAFVRPQGMIERYRLLQGVQAVAQRRLEINQSAHLRAFTSLHDVDRSHDVGPRIFGPTVRILVRGCGVNDAFRLEVVEQPIDQRAVDDGALDDGQIRRRTQVVAPAGRIVVDHQYVVAARMQAIGDVRSDESGPTRYQNVSHVHLDSADTSACCLNSTALSWNSRCHTSRQNRPQVLRPNRDSLSICFTTRRLSIKSRWRARQLLRMSMTQSRTSPFDHSVHGVGKPILSVRLTMTSGRYGCATSLSMCFNVPFRNFTSAGMVAANSTRG